MKRSKAVRSARRSLATLETITVDVATPSARISAPVSAAPGSGSSVSAASVGTVAPGNMLWKILLPAGMVIPLIGGVLYFRSTRPAKLTERDTVVLADFSNTTGDPVFDGTLKQALAVGLDHFYGTLPGTSASPPIWYAMSGDSAKARIAYQDFLTKWKDADPDIPMLKEAKVEYANLQ